MKQENTLLLLFPAEMRSFWQETAQSQSKVSEIRLRTNQPIILIINGQETFLDESGRPIQRLQNAKILTGRELSMILEHICQYSQYAYEDELRQGFLTVRGGHRVGVAGQAVVTEDGRIHTMKHISCINIRISHEILGAANRLLPILYQNHRPLNVLLIAPPGCGKTTLLRDLIRQISDGNAYGRGRCVGVVDERSELAGTSMGQSQNQLGMRTDVLDGCPKKIGVRMLLRVMAPEVIAVDELGDYEDMKVLKEAAASGCRILGTAHGESVEDISERFNLPLRELSRIFDLFVILEKRDGVCRISRVVKGMEENAEVIRSCHDFDRMWRNRTVV